MTQRLLLKGDRWKWPLKVTIESDHWKWPLKVTIERWPLKSRHWKAAIERSSLKSRHWRVAIERLSLKGCYWKVAIERLLLKGRHCKVAIERSPLKGRHWKVVIERSPLKLSSSTWKSRKGCSLNLYTKLTRRESVGNSVFKGGSVEDYLRFNIHIFLLNLFVPKIGWFHKIELQETNIFPRLCSIHLLQAYNFEIQIQSWISHNSCE